jgi:uncharacterized protein (AIM24 family)
MGERVMTRAGAMVAYDGQMKFEKSILGGEGLFGALKRRVGGEGFDLMTTSGSGRVYVAQNAAEILLVPLNNDRIFIESSSVLALRRRDALQHRLRRLRGASSGQGLFTTTIEGTGNVAAFTDGTALALEVTPDEPCSWTRTRSSGTRATSPGVRLRRELEDARGAILRRELPLKFSGGGVVYIQPSERR